MLTSAATTVIRLPNSVRAELDDPHAGMRPGRHKIWPSVFGVPCELGAVGHQDH
jgi:hypothetical protein